jgi:hypothetical protein
VIGSSSPLTLTAACLLPITSEVALLTGAAVPLARLLESAPVMTPVLAQPVSQSVVHRHTVGRNFIEIGFSTDEAQPER